VWGKLTVTKTKRERNNNHKKNKPAKEKEQEEKKTQYCLLNSVKTTYLICKTFSLTTSIQRKEKAMNNRIHCQNGLKHSPKIYKIKEGGH
jgi:hypothetical protein